MDKQRYLVTPVAKAMQVLDAVASRDEGVRLSAVAKQVGLPKTTVFRYLCTLEATGYLDCDPAEESYRVGARFRALGSPGDALKRLRAAGSPAASPPARVAFRPAPRRFDRAQPSWPKSSA